MSEDYKIIRIRGTAIPLRGNDIDTDRIIPARFLKCVTFTGIGEKAFYDERFDANGNLKIHPFNDVKYQGGNILVVNRNFGCGSSREHAPQALLDYGIRAIAGDSFAEIFKGNCTSLGIPVIELSQGYIESLMTMVEEVPGVIINIDLKDRRLECGGTFYDFNISGSAKYVLIEGKWDSIALLLENKEDIERTAAEIPYLHWHDD
ncbi:MAG: 3-isopropylmalate dehydratase small subunit [bacterium]|nr:3-isopropylmalate dehydratase small subunit [bacterium]